MKLKGSFDAKRLRPREPRNWGARLAAGLSALLATLGANIKARHRELARTALDHLKGDQD